MAEIIYLNGRLIPRSKAKLSPFDHGFLYGYGLFETMQAYQRHIFASITTSPAFAVLPRALV